MSINDMISIIVPVYNAEEYLKTCIESVLHSTYANFELLCIDDGSTDNSLCILERYSLLDSRIKVFTKENGGVSSARNVGLEKCQGRYVFFLDSDDYITKDCIHTLYNELNRISADIVSGITMDQNHSTSNTCEIWQHGGGVEQSLKDNPITYSVWGKLYRRSIIDKTRFNEKFFVNEDSLFLFELLCKEPVFVSTNKNVYYYRKTENSLSRTAFSDRYFAILDIAEIKYRAIKEKFPEQIKLAENMRLKATMNMLQLLALRTKREYRITEKKLLKYVGEKKQYFIPATKENKEWFFIITHHLYFVYKFFFFIFHKF